MNLLDCPLDVCGLAQCDRFILWHASAETITSEDF